MLHRYVGARIGFSCTTFECLQAFNDNFDTVFAQLSLWAHRIAQQPEPKRRPRIHYATTRKEMFINVRKLKIFFSLCIVLRKCGNVSHMTSFRRFWAPWRNPFVCKVDMHSKGKQLSKKHSTETEIIPKRLIMSVTVSDWQQTQSRHWNTRFIPVRCWIIAQHVQNILAVSFRYCSESILQIFVFWQMQWPYYLHN